MAIHVDHLEAPSVPAEVITGGGHPPEAMQQEARQGVKAADVLARERLALQQLLERLERQRRIDQPGAVLTAPDRRLLLLFAAGQITHDRLHQIGERHQAFDTAVLVGDQGDLDPVLAELTDHRQGAGRLGDVERLLQQSADLDGVLLEMRRQQGMTAHDADAVIEVTAAHRQT